MTTTNAKIGDSIIRIQGTSSEYGTRGEIIEIDTEAGRARIAWEPYHTGTKRPRTWIKLASIIAGDTYTDEQIASHKKSMKAAEEARWNKRYGHLNR